MKQEYQAFIAKVKAHGGRLLQFPCPCCHKEIETLAPSGRSVWDTLATCPFCEGTFIKVVTATGVQTDTLSGENIWQK